MVYMPRHYNILKAKDKNESKIVRKDMFFDLPARILLCGRTGTGKGNTILNYCVRDMYYNKDFDGSDIFIFSPSLRLDRKTKMLIKNKRIPNENLFETLDEDNLGAVLDFLEETYLEHKAETGKSKHSLIIIDDCLPKMKEKQNGAFQSLFIRGRHFCVSVCATLQFYNKCPPVCRNNASGLVLWDLNAKQLDDIIADHNYLDSKKDFMEKFRKATSRSSHSNFIINYSNPKDKMYLNENFKPI